MCLLWAWHFRWGFFFTWIQRQNLWRIKCIGCVNESLVSRLVDYELWSEMRQSSAFIGEKPKRKLFPTQRKTTIMIMTMISRWHGGSSLQRQCESNLCNICTHMHIHKSRAGWNTSDKTICVQHRNGTMARKGKTQCFEQLSNKKGQ